MHKTKYQTDRNVPLRFELQDGETPVFLAVKNSCIDCLEVLLEARADPNICANVNIVLFLVAYEMSTDHCNAGW